ncbi:hypothetical protein C0993_005803 [Termitomyces sp. T159_Od127]|nr:hypothetical protein C0993_005803 [Termitomyces sp. T159_Od127]
MESFRPFRVIGHAGMRTTLDGALIIKPAYPAERRFYEALVNDPYLAPMRPFIPRFLGTLSEHAVDAARLNVPPGRTEFLMLENLCSAFSRPNTLDIKLGTVFHDDTTDPAKVLRMQKTSRETTSLSTGVRLTEFHVHDNKTLQPVYTPKSYGKSLKEPDLPLALAQFFPAHGDGDPAGGTLGLPRRLLVPVLRGIRDIVACIREAYARLEMRVVGGSLLVMYEADWARAEQALLDGIEASEDADNRRAGLGRPPYVVKLVDFAHTRIGRGLGPDQGVLLGLDTLLRLLDGRVRELALLG